MTRPAKPLFFHAMGVPRSGTTYFAQLLNSHEKVVCGLELMTGESFEARFLYDFPGKMPADSQRKEIYRRQLKSKVKASCFGDKLPKGYLHLKHIVDEINEGPVFFLLRDMPEVFLSWDMRSNNPSDEMWPYGMNWIFAYLHHAIALSEIKSAGYKHLHLVNYHRLTDLEERHAMSKSIFEVFGFELTQGVESFLHDVTARTMKIATKSRVPTTQQLAVIEQDFAVEYARFVSDIRVRPFDEEISSRIDYLLQLFESDVRRHLPFWESLFEEQKKDAAFSRYLEQEVGHIRRYPFLDDFLSAAGYESGFSGSLKLARMRVKKMLGLRSRES